MSDTTTPLLSEDLRTWKHHGHELKAHRIESLAQHAEQMEAENAALRERLAVLEGQGVEPVAYASKDQLEKLDLIGDMMVSSEKDETFSVPYDIPLYIHPSPTPSDASLRAAAQVAADALASISEQPTHCGDPDYECPLHDLGTCYHPVTEALTALAEQGVKPTNKP